MIVLDTLRTGRVGLVMSPHDLHALLLQFDGSIDPADVPPIVLRALNEAEGNTLAIPASLEAKIAEIKTALNQMMHPEDED